ncbi:hypothetical protein CLV40_116146 [Actinokineospora auranticolor]|uniref:Uncharacterized protein n=1 Tax=Actinokineospora auranticolor TaxID=155976 RepID=A0A2S6GIT9_9PSEU|nr:hypothetical protein CLV40_116146 [Actinokineospora auranticolor]
MSGHERPSRLNRALLAATGLLLLAAGGFALATRFAVLDVLPPEGHLVPGSATAPTWVWYTTAACGVVLGLLAIRWLVAQVIRKPKTHTWRFDTDTGRTDLSASTAVGPLLAEAETYPGVHTARGTLAGTRDNPTLVLVISTEQDAEPAAIRRALATRGVPRLCRVLDLGDLPTTVEFRFTDEPAARFAASPADSGDDLRAHATGGPGVRTDQVAPLTENHSTADPEAVRPR